jgi:hypothetical protein
LGSGGYEGAGEPEKPLSGVILRFPALSAAAFCSPGFIVYNNLYSRCVKGYKKAAGSWIIVDSFLQGELYYL